MNYKASWTCWRNWYVSIPFFSKDNSTTPTVNPAYDNSSWETRCFSHGFLILSLRVFTLLLLDVHISKCSAYTSSRFLVHMQLQEFKQGDLCASAYPLDAEYTLTNLIQLVYSCNKKSSMTLSFAIFRPTSQKLRQLSCLALSLEGIMNSKASFKFMITSQGLKSTRDIANASINVVHRNTKGKGKRLSSNFSSHKKKPFIVIIIKFYSTQGSFSNSGSSCWLQKTRWPCGSLLFLLRMPTPNCRNFPAGYSLPFMMSNRIQILIIGSRPKQHIMLHPMFKSWTFPINVRVKFNAKWATEIV